jgi:hypothetical protein
MTDAEPLGLYVQQAINLDIHRLAAAGASLTFAARLSRTAPTS